MLIEIHSFEEYEDFITKISAKPDFTDPHFSYNPNNLFNALDKEDHKAFVVINEGVVTGLFVWLIIQDEHYAELIIGLSEYEDAYEEMLTYMEVRYTHYQLDFVINPQNKVLRILLEKKHARFEKEQQEMVWKTETVIENNCQVQLLTPDYENQYKEIHIKDTYWTAEKVLEASSRFRIFIALKDDEVMGYLDITSCHDVNEPYSLFVKEQCTNDGYKQALLNEAIKMNKPNGMMVLVDIDANEEISLYKNAGFEKVEGHNSIYATYKSNNREQVKE